MHKLILSKYVKSIYTQHYKSYSHISLQNTPLFSSIIITDAHLTGLSIIIYTTGRVSHVKSIKDAVKVKGSLGEKQICCLY